MIAGTSSIPTQPLPDNDMPINLTTSNNAANTPNVAASAANGDASGSPSHSLPADGNVKFQSNGNV